MDTLLKWVKLKPSIDIGIEMRWRNRHCDSAKLLFVFLVLPPFFANTFLSSFFLFLHDKKRDERTNVLQQEMRKERGKKDEREGERSRDGGRKEAFFPEEKAPLAVCAIFLLPLLLPLPFFSLLSLFLLLRRCHQR